jgi:arylsulfatase A-like enzyme
MSQDVEGRRSFLKASIAASIAAAVPSSMDAQAKPAAKAPSAKPNIILYLSDQFRADFIGANGGNSSTRTANLDRLALRGTNFAQAITNQPLCSPSRSVLLTSRYATETGVWRLGLPMDRSLPTLAEELRKAGYSANCIGKWHLALEDPKAGGTSGPVRNPEDRGGFLDLWEAANAPENSTHPYEGTFWDRDNQPISYKDEYRVDFLTDRAERFLRQKHDRPFLLFVSQLEPHPQNARINHPLGPVAPKGVAARFANSTVPHDVRAYPGTWQEYLPDYYGCVEAIDSSVGRIQRILKEEHLAENTIFVFLSDHGCHFETRNISDKCSAHESSIRVPLILDGPGFRNAQQIPELVGLIDLAPTLLEAAGVPVSSTWKGRSLLPLLRGAEARERWPNQQFIQISGTMTGRAIRTRDWTYCIADLSGDISKPAAATYHEYQMYDLRADPEEFINLAGRKEYRAKADELRGQLATLMVAAGEPEPVIVPAKLYP